MCIYSPMPHTLSYCALIGKCALIRSNTVYCLLRHLVAEEWVEYGVRCWGSGVEPQEWESSSEQI